MKVSRVLVVLLPLFAGACAQPGSPSAPSPVGASAALEAQAAKVDVCHVSGDGSVHAISVAGSAVPAHLRHGDATRVFSLPAGATFSANNALEDYVPALAFDLDPLTNWNAGYWPVAWLEVDFGSPQRFSVMTGLPDQLPAVSFTNHDITSDGAPAFSWTGITTNNQLITQTFGTMQTAQRVRITTTVSDSWVAWWEVGFRGC
ncbi:MAG: discoidin domain-containing protein [Acidobacteria bacterium]|nr:discoidin domain-containing protein [Acidobacteriota bacterium]